MVAALTDTDLGGGLVLHGADRERQGRESFVHFDEECASALHLEVVNLLKFALVNSAAGVVLLGLTFARGDEDVEADHIAGLELELLDALGGGSSVDDDIVAVDNVSLHFVREDTFDSVALELLANLLNDFSDFGVGCSDSNFALSSLEGVPCGQNNVSLASTDGTSSDYDSRGGVRGISIEVGTAHAIVKVKRRSND